MHRGRVGNGWDGPATRLGWTLRWETWPEKPGCGAIKGCGSTITGPAHIAHVEQLRAAAVGGNSDLPATKCDIFVFAEGESPRRDVTKVNGLPYRPAGRPWPTSTDGDPMTFLAQFRFTESRDLVGQTPGDLLLVFATDDSLLPFDQPQESLLFEWYPLGLGDLVGAEACPPPRWRFAHCHGVRHRTVDYPGLEAERMLLRVVPSAARRHMPDDLVVRPLCCLDGMKIGGAPLWYDSGAGPNWEPIQGQFLCSLSAISPELRKPFPWINHPAPIPFDAAAFTQDMLLFCANGFILNFFIDADGRITWGMQIFT